MQTAFGAAFAKAGVDTATASLAAIATNLLQRTGGNFGRALAQFSAMIHTVRDLRRALALQYMQDRADDMRGESLRRDGHEDRDPTTRVQMNDATPTRLNEGETGRVSDANKLAMTRLPASPSPNTDDGGHLKNAEQSATEDLPTSSVPKPNPPRALDSRLRVVTEISKTVLDTFKVRDGRAIGDLLWHELTKLAVTNESEARVLRYVLDHAASPPVRPYDKVRDIVKAEVIDAAIKHSEAVNAAA